MQNLKGYWEIGFDKVDEDLEIEKISFEDKGGLVENEYHLLETTKDRAGEIIQFLIAYHNFKSEYFDWDND